jgi:tetratricopeptide (TPR) repeat protein
VSHTQSSGQIRLCFLGPVEIRRDDKLLDLGPKRAALLAYLALEGRSRRKTLAQLLWSGSDDPLNNLAVSLTGMKRVLGADALEIDAQFIALQDVQSDVQTWCEGIAKRDPSIWDLHRGVLLEGLEVRDWAVGLGEEFEEWLYARREELETQWRTLASMIATTHLQATQYEKALPFLNLACGDVGPQEDASRRLILTLGALERRDEAIQVYTVLAQQQREELGVEPTARTRAALAAARNGAFESEAMLAREWLHLEPGTNVVLAPLVGRQTELTMLDTLLEPSGTVRVPAVVLRGEPGVGKTRLAQALRERWLSNRHGGILFGGSVVRAALPLQTFDSAIRQLVQQHPAVLDQMPTAWRDALARWMPDALNPTGQPNAPDLERLGVFEAIRALLDQQQPVLIWLDDLQWADALTLELIQHLITKPPRAGLVFVATTREQPHDSSHVGEFLRFVAQVQGRVHEVKPLDQIAIMELAKALNQPDIDATQLRAVSGGNPLHVLELLRADPDTQARQMQDLIDARLDVQPEVSQQTVEALGVLGDQSKVGLLQRVSGRSAEETATVLEQLSRVGLVQVGDAGVQFEHDLIRQAVLNRTHLARAGILHLRAARAQRQEALAAAGHFWVARDLWEADDQTPAIRAMLEAASAYMLRGDVDGGLVWFDRVLGCPLSLKERVQALTTRSKMLERHSKYGEALADLETAETLAFEGDAGLVAAVLNAKADLLVNAFSDVPQATQVAEQALGVLRDAIGENTQAERARALSVLGWCHFINRDFIKAEECYRKAIQIQRALNLSHDLAASLTTLGSVLHHTDLQGSFQVLQEAIELATSIDNQSVLAAANDKIGIAYRLTGALETAIRHAKQAIAIRGVNGSEFVPGVWMNNLGNMHFDCGNFLAAKDAYQQGLKANDLQKNPFHLVTILSNLVEVGLRLAQFEMVRQALTEAKSLLNQQPLPALEADLCWFEGELAVLEGNLDHASACYRRSAMLAQASQSLHREATAYARLSRLELSAEWAKQACVLEDSTDSRASQHFVLGNFDTARLEIESSQDTYELLRFELDCGLALNDSLMQTQARARLPLQFMLN